MKIDADLKSYKPHTLQRWSEEARVSVPCYIESSLRPIIYLKTPVFGFRAADEAQTTFLRGPWAEGEGAVASVGKCTPMTLSCLGFIRANLEQRCVRRASLDTATATPLRRRRVLLRRPFLRIWVIPAGVTRGGGRGGEGSGGHRRVGLGRGMKGHGGVGRGQEERRGLGRKYWEQQVAVGGAGRDNDYGGS
ncbi:hypothetical protein E2C01_017603 [Portunus trituberculatus]|uniref:Uncharacterized protein n=1 Tax=Portunus trituberculatus TaxID=210409 RepID=A0A5B7DSX2_PORTR|nr:hypothetical protein [Portunus trituberculatus]